MKLVVQDLACERDGQQIFSGLGFTVSSGGALVVRGPNGSGKSSLLRILAGLLPAASGAVALEGDNTGANGTSPVRLAHLVHYAGHRDALKASLNAREVLSFWARFLGSGRNDGMTVEAALTAFGLADAPPLPVACLSAGERRRLALARLLVSARPVWLLDEPATGLDNESRRRLADVVARHRAHGGLVVMATHEAHTPDGANTIHLGATP